jgi:hypothetical protein
MNIQELIGKYEYLNHDCFRRVDTSEVLKDLKLLDEPQKVKIPQFVANWIKYCKNTFLSLARALMIEEVDFYNYANQEDHSRLIDFFGSGINQETFARAWLDGYEVEKEPKYTVRVKGINGYGQYLNKASSSKTYCFASEIEKYGYKTKHTRKELEEDGFGWVFDCPGIEIEEVTE